MKFLKAINFKFLNKEHNNELNVSFELQSNILDKLKNYNTKTVNKCFKLIILLNFKMKNVTSFFYLIERPYSKSTKHQRLNQVL